MDNIGIAYNAEKSWPVAVVTSGECNGGCGSGNFLYVTLEHMKRLEGEVLNLLHDLGETQGLLEMQGITVDPHQFLGLELNPRAARIAEMVLWIGYLQWHFRTHGKVNPPEPVLRDFHNIENRDALLTYDEQQVIVDSTGVPLTRWDGHTYKTSPITGELIPDESAQIEQYRYINPKKATWPGADYIVGNPPFIGNKRMRIALGDGYVEAVRNTWEEVPESIDFVMYWWHIAASKVQCGDTKQFGFITTNSIRQSFNQKVIKQYLNAKCCISLIFAIPDHPWVDSSDGAAVRIAMTACALGESTGILKQSIKEASLGNEEIDIVLSDSKGKIFSDLKIGVDFGDIKSLKSNTAISNRGVIPHGDGMTVTEEQAKQLGLGSKPGIENYLRPYRNGRDLAQTSRNLRVIDMYGLSIDTVQDELPQIYQWLYDRVKPSRDLNKDKDLREKWWLHRRSNEDLRNSIQNLGSYIATVQTCKHRFFTTLDSETLPDDKLIAIALEDGFFLGVLSSRLHVVWALATGGRLGVGNDPIYNKSQCFEAFPFPETTVEMKMKIRVLAERLDTHRKHQKEQFPKLTLTSMYNVLEKLRSGEELSDKDKVIHEQGLVSVLRELHDELDRAVFTAYGWDDLADKLVGLPGATTPLPDKPEAQAAAEEELLQRLVDLNTQRAAEEANGHIRWLRPEYQNPDALGTQKQSELAVDSEAKEALPASKSKKLKWPKLMREQVAAVRNALEIDDLTLEAISQQFMRNPEKHVASVLGALKDLGMVEETEGLYSLKL